VLVLYTTYKVLYYSDYKLEKIILIIISFSVNNKNRKKFILITKIVIFTI